MKVVLNTIKLNQNIHLKIIYVHVHQWYMPLTNGGRRGRDRMVVGFTTIPMQSVPITTDVVSSNIDQGEVFNIM